MRNSVSTKEIRFATKVEKNHKRMSQYNKECCNKVEELEEETSVTKKENYVQTKDEEDKTKDCRNKEIYVATEFRTVKNDKLCCNKVFMS